MWQILWTPPTITLSTHYVFSLILYFFFIFNYENNAGKDETHFLIFITSCMRKHRFGVIFPRSVMTMKIFHSFWHTKLWNHKRHSIGDIFYVANHCGSCVKMLYLKASLKFRGMQEIDIFLHSHAWVKLRWQYSISMRMHWLNIVVEMKLNNHRRSPQFALLPYFNWVVIGWGKLLIFPRMVMR